MRYVQYAATIDDCERPDRGLAFWIAGWILNAVIMMQRIKLNVMKNLFNVHPSEAKNP